MTLIYIFLSLCLFNNFSSRRAAGSQPVHHGGPRNHEGALYDAEQGAQDEAHGLHRFRAYYQVSALD
jgi:hypothetical protein